MFGTKTLEVLKAIGYTTHGTAAGKATNFKISKLPERELHYTENVLTTMPWNVNSEYAEFMQDISSSLVRRESTKE